MNELWKRTLLVMLIPQSALAIDCRQSLLPDEIKVAVQRRSHGSVVIPVNEELKLKSKYISSLRKQLGSFFANSKISGLRQESGSLDITLIERDPKRPRYWLYHRLEVFQERYVNYQRQQGLQGLRLNLSPIFSLIEVLVEQIEGLTDEIELQPKVELTKVRMLYSKSWPEGEASQVHLPDGPLDNSSGLYLILEYRKVL